MATLSDWVGDVRAIIGETTASFWTDDELETWLIEEIRNAQNDAPDEALADLYATKTGASTGGSIYSMGSSFRKLINFRDANGVWDVTEDRGYWESLKSEDGNQSYANTTIRLAVVVGTSVYTYPVITSGVAYTAQYIGSASESGTMTLPTEPNLKEVAIRGAAAKAFAKESFDMDGVGIQTSIRENRMKAIWRRYGYDR